MSRQRPARTSRATEVAQEVRALVRRSRALLADWAELVSPGLTPTEYAALVAVDESGQLRGSDLSGRLRLDKSTVSRIVARLVDLRFVEVSPDERDGRARLLQLTPAGERWLQAARAEQHKRFLDYVGSWPEEDLERLAKLLHRLNGDLSR